MGGPEMAPQTPQRSGRPGVAGAPLYYCYIPYCYIPALISPQNTYVFRSWADLCPLIA